MEIKYVFQGEIFLWNAKKAQANIKKHGVTFEEACEVFFDPFYHMRAAGQLLEQRWAITGYSEIGRLLYVIAVEKADDAWRIISARPATTHERLSYEKNDTH